MRIKPKFSLIVPVYNVELYIIKCLTSISNQSFRDFEVILVNDGSTDNSAAICEDFVSKNKNFTYISQQNKGLSSARNVALPRATGEYIWFIDSDDWIATDALKRLTELLKEEIEIVGFSNYHFLEKENLLKKNTISENTATLHCENIESKINAFEIAPWIYIFKRSFLDKHKIIFREDIKLHEDEFFLAECFLKLTKIKFTEDALYYHRIRPGSLMRTPNIIRKLSVLAQLQQVYDSYRGTDKYINYWESRMYSLAVIFYKLYFKLDKPVQKKLRVQYNLIREIQLNNTVADNVKTRTIKFLHNKFFFLFKYYLLRK